jgi:PAS domain S-box-containing protein
VSDAVEQSSPATSVEAGESGAMLSAILDGMGVGFYALDGAWRITIFNSEAERHFGRARNEVLRRGLWEVFPEARDTDLGRQFAHAMASRQTVTSETVSVVAPGRALEYRLFPLGDGMGVRFRDITDRRRAEAHRDLLVDELNHRVKNTLATVQAIAAQTLRNAGVDSSVQRSLEARLLTLSNVHNVLTHENWDSAELRDVVWAALRPHCAPGREHFTVGGPDLRVRPQSAVALSMALHELCTYAVKYGALSSERGHVDVGWTIAGERFRLRWREEGGPPVVRPGQKGFGSRLIERGLAAELSGRAQIDYDPAGVSCLIDAPLEAVRDTDGAAEKA